MDEFREVSANFVVEEPQPSSLELPDLVAAKELFIRLSDINPDGYKRYSVEIDATDTFLYYSYESEQYHDEPPAKYETKYFQAKDNLNWLWAEAETAAYLARTQEAINGMEHFLTHFAGMDSHLYRLGYIYDLYLTVVNPYLVAIGEDKKKEIDVTKVLELLEKTQYFADYVRRPYIEMLMPDLVAKIPSEYLMGYLENGIRYCN